MQSESEPAVAANKPICVTGASGYIASFIVRDLLAKGYKVRGTVRSVNDDSKNNPIKALPNAQHNLQLVEADMLHPHNFEEILQGCVALIHTATPIYFPADGSVPFKTVEQVEAEQVKPAVEGTRALLRAAVNVGIKKVVLTSSTSAMTGKPVPDPVLNEDSWSDIEYVRSTQLLSAAGPSRLAKTLQERLAWEMSAKHGFKLVCIHPFMTLGPQFTPMLSLSMEFLLPLAKGDGLPFESCRKGMIPDAYLPMVDVRDVARAHVLALQKKEANGRYLLLTHRVHCEEVVRTLRQSATKFGQLAELQLDSVDGKRHAEGQFSFDCGKVRQLGVDITPWQDTIAEAAKVLQSWL